MIDDVDEYFSKGCGRCKRFATSDCSTRKWDRGLSHLRRICLSAGLIETVKWGHPCYTHGGRNIVILGAFRGDFRLNFFNPMLMKDPENVLEKRGPNTQNPGMIRFKDNACVGKMEPIVRSYLIEAMGYAERGVLPPKQQKRINLPDELVEVLETDRELGAAFHNLTPGRQRSYVINLNSAKQSATRLTRIAKFREKILAGKGATER